MSFEPPPPALQVKLLSESAKAPTRGSAHAAGYDLYASQATTVPANGKALVELDISIAVPAGTYGRIAPRSGLASKHSIHTGAGVIDADYRGPVKALLFNLGIADFEVAVGDRVAQLIVERVSSPLALRSPKRIMGTLLTEWLFPYRSTPLKLSSWRSSRRPSAAPAGSAQRVALALFCRAWRQRIREDSRN